MIGPRHERAELQSDFYRIQYHRVLRWLVYSLIIIYLLIAGVFYFIFAQPTQNFYANTSEGRILPMPNAERGA